MEVGDKITFMPTAWTVLATEKARDTFGVATKVTGTIVQINEEHRWYRVRYEVAGTIQHETFKF